MCFSAQASFTVALSLCLVGCYTLVKTPIKKLRLLAMTPLFFGLQQAFEGVVWITLNAGDTTSIIHKGAVYGFVFFASMFWPLWIPGSFYVAEKQRTRKQLLGGFFVIGILFAITALFCLWITPLVAQVVQHHMSYSFFTQPFGQLPPLYKRSLEYGLLVAYLIPVVVSFFISSIPYAWIAGWCIAIAYIVAQHFYAVAFGSVWCFFGAVVSASTYCIIRTTVKRYYSNNTESKSL